MTLASLHGIWRCWVCFEFRFMQTVVNNSSSMKPLNVLNNLHTEIIHFFRFESFKTERSHVKGAGIFFFFVNWFSSLIWVQSDERDHIQLIERPSSSSDCRWFRRHYAETLFIKSSQTTPKTLTIEVFFLLHRIVTAFEVISCRSKLWVSCWIWTEKHLNTQFIKNIIIRVQCSSFTSVLQIRYVTSCILLLVRLYLVLIVQC